MSFYDGTAPIFVRQLTALSAILKKAEAYAAEHKIEPSVLLNDRLHPTMLPLTKQVQLACDFSGKACARLTQTDVPTMEDNETTFAQLQARIDKVLANIAALPSAKYEGGDKREITVPIGKDKTMTLPGQQFFNHMALPNFMFHVTTAYNILRHNGLDIGKMDFLGVR